MITNLFVYTIYINIYNFIKQKMLVIQLQNTHPLFKTRIFVVYILTHCWRTLGKILSDNRKYTVPKWHRPKTYSVRFKNNKWKVSENFQSGKKQNRKEAINTITTDNRTTCLRCHFIGTQYWRPPSVMHLCWIRAVPYVKDLRVYKSRLFKLI